MESTDLSYNLAGREFKLSVSKIHTQASGYIIASLGDTVIMANASISSEAKEGTDFFPMTVDYE